MFALIDCNTIASAIPIGASMTKSSKPQGFQQMKDWIPGLSEIARHWSSTKIICNKAPN